MEKSRSRGIRVWFWSRTESCVPSTVKEDFGVVEPDSFGRPEAHFPTTACDYLSHFDDHQLIINTALCVSLVQLSMSSLRGLTLLAKGDWAGSVFSNTQCGRSSCPDCEFEVLPPSICLVDACFARRQQQPGCVQECVLGDQLAPRLHQILVSCSCAITDP